MTEATITWRRLDVPGRETARLSRSGRGWRLSGSASFSAQDGASALAYVIECDEGWRTRTCRVTGVASDRSVDVHIDVDEAGVWRLNGLECLAVRSCLDVDLNFSPSTNLLPIRRLRLAPGQAADVKAAWLRFPSFTLDPLPQRYQRLDPRTYRYESAGGSFVRELTVNDAGFVTTYPGFWEAEA
jgi:hypothetical protein